MSAISNSNQTTFDWLDFLEWCSKNRNTSILVVPPKVAKVNKRAELKYNIAVIIANKLCQCEYCFRINFYSGWKPTNLTSIFSLWTSIFTSPHGTLLMAYRCLYTDVCRCQMGWFPPTLIYICVASTKVAKTGTSICCFHYHFLPLT